MRSEVDYLVLELSSRLEEVIVVRTFFSPPFFAVYCFDTLKIAKYGKVVSNSVFVQTHVADFRCHFQEAT